MHYSAHQEIRFSPRPCSSAILRLERYKPFHVPKCTMCVTENTTFIVLFVTFDGHCVTLQDFLVNMSMVVAGVAMIILNGVVLHTLIRSRSLEDPGHHFITNLAAADSLTGFFVIYDVWYNILQFKNYSECVLRMGFFQAVNISSVFTLAVLTCDRYIKICYPFFYQRFVTTCRVRLVCLAIWFMAVLIGLFPVFGWSTMNRQRICQFFGIMVFGYLKLTIVLFYIPFAIMTVVYIRLIFLARKHSQAMASMPGNIGCSVWRSVKTASIIVGAYFICWAPVGIFLMLVMDGRLNRRLPLGANVIFTYLFGVGLINSLLNPVIYATKIDIINARFREICCWCTRGRRKSNASSATTSTSSRGLTSARTSDTPRDSLDIPKHLARC